VRPPEEITLHWKQIAAQRAISGYELVGLHGEDLYARLSDVADLLVVGLSGYVMADQGGDPVTVERTVARKRRPLWLPSWLWRRIPEETKRFTLTATPEWTYPQATVRVPALSPAVQFLATDTYETEWTP